MKSAKVKKTAQNIQDDIFREMPIEKKIKLASDFFELARSLNPRAFQHGTRKTTAKNRRHSREA